MSAVRPDTETLIQRPFGTRISDMAEQIQTSKIWKFEVHHFFDLLIYGIYAIDLLIASHLRPFLVQLDTFGVFHNDVFAPNGICRIIAPIKDGGYRNVGLGLY